MEMKHTIIILVALAFVACDNKPPCSLAELQAGRTECERDVFEALECIHHGDHRRQAERQLTSPMLKVAVSGACAEHVVLDIPAQWAPIADRGAMIALNDKIASLGFVTIAHCVAGANCEVSEHPPKAPYIIHPSTLKVLDSIGVDVTPYIATGHVGGLQ